MKAWPPPGLFPVLAHQGGWDESLLVVGPLVVSRLEEAEGDGAADGAGPGVDGPTEAGGPPASGASASPR